MCNQICDLGDGLRVPCTVAAVVRFRPFSPKGQRRLRITRMFAATSRAVGFEPFGYLGSPIHSNSKLAGSRRRATGSGRTRDSGARDFLRRGKGGAAKAATCGVLCVDSAALQAGFDQQSVLRCRRFRPELREDASIL